MEEPFPGDSVVAVVPAVGSRVNRGPVYVGSFESSSATFVVGLGALEDSASVRDVGLAELEESWYSDRDVNSIVVPGTVNSGLPLGSTKVMGALVLAKVIVLTGTKTIPERVDEGDDCDDCTVSSAVFEENGEELETCELKTEEGVEVAAIEELETCTLETEGVEVAAIEDEFTNRG